MSDARWNDPREYDARDRGDQWPRVYDPRDRDEYDPREALMRDLDLPRGSTRRPVRDRDRWVSLRESEVRMLATAGAFRVVVASDLRDSRGRPAQGSASARRSTIPGSSRLRFPSTRRRWSA